jgi:hypothetical protein
MTNWGLEGRSSIPGMGSVKTGPIIQWVPEVHSQGKKRSEREADHSLPSSDQVKNVCELYWTIWMRIFLIQTYEYIHFNDLDRDITWQRRTRKIQSHKHKFRSTKK